MDNMEVSFTKVEGHITTHYPCLNCEAIYDSLSKLNRHISLFHEEYKPYKCANCGICFEKEDEVLNHIDLCGKTLSIKCSYCLVSFDNEDELAKHSELPHPYQCLDCENAFVLKSSLGKHIKLHHPPDFPQLPSSVGSLIPVRIQCNLCPATFASKSKLQRHNNGVHLKLRPFKCTDCSITFTQQATLNKHNKDRHQSNYKHAGKRKKKKFGSLKKTLINISKPKINKKEANKSEFVAVPEAVENDCVNFIKKSINISNIEAQISDSAAENDYANESTLSDTTRIAEETCRKTYLIDSANANISPEDKSPKSKEDYFSLNCNIKIKEAANEHIANVVHSESENNAQSGKFEENSPKNQCFLCNRIYSQRSSLNRHLRDVHSYDTNCISKTPKKRTKDSQEIGLDENHIMDTCIPESASVDFFPKNIRRKAISLIENKIPEENKLGAYISDQESIENNALSNHDSGTSEIVYNDNMRATGSIFGFQEQSTVKSGEDNDNSLPIELNRNVSEYLAKRNTEYSKIVPLPDDTCTKNDNLKITSRDPTPIFGKDCSSIQSLQCINAEESKASFNSDRIHSCHPLEILLEASLKELNGSKETEKYGWVGSENINHKTEFNKLIEPKDFKQNVANLGNCLEKEPVPNVEYGHLSKVKRAPQAMTEYTKSINEFEFTSNVSKSQMIDHQTHESFSNSSNKNNEYSYSSDTPSFSQSELPIPLNSQKFRRASRTDIEENVFNIKSDEEDEPIAANLKQQINEIYLRLEENDVNDEKYKSQNQNLVQCRSRSSYEHSDFSEMKQYKYDADVHQGKEMSQIGFSEEASCKEELTVPLNNRIDACSYDNVNAESGATFNRRTSKRLSSLNSQEVEKSVSKKCRGSRSLSTDSDKDNSMRSYESLPLERTEEEEQFLYLQRKEILKANELLMSNSNQDKTSPVRQRGRPPKRKISDVVCSVDNPPKKRSKPDDFVEGTFRCMECHAMFYKKKDYEAHMDNTHSETRPFKCKKCSACFKNDKALEIHDAAVHEKLKPHICPKCGTGFGQRASLYRHMKEVIHNLIYCSDCNACFNVKKDLAEHINNFHITLKPFKCDQCDRSFVSRHQLAIHTATVHEKRRPYKCEQCGAAFGQRGSLHRHLKTVDHKILPFSCSYCSGQFRRKEDLKKHIDAEHKKSHLFKCCVCDISFKFERMLDNHIREVHSKDIIDTNSKEVQMILTSPKDNSDMLHNHDIVSNSGIASTIKSSKMLNKHIKVNNTSETLPNELSISGTIDCNNKAFCNETLLNTHTKTIHQGSVAICPNCRKVFNNKKQLKRHMEYATTNANILECVYCKVQFCQKKHLSIHIKDAHLAVDSSEVCEKDVTIKEENLEEINEIQLKDTSNRPIYENFSDESALSVRPSLENMTDSTKTKLDAVKNLIHDGVSYKNAAESTTQSMGNDSFSDKGFHVLRYSPPEKSKDLLNSEKVDVVNMINQHTAENVSSYKSSKVSSDLIQNSYNLDVQSDSGTNNNLYQGLKNSMDSTGYKENPEPSLVEKRETYVITKQENNSQKCHFIGESKAEEQVIYSNPTTEPIKFVREYYEDHPNSFVRNSNYIHPNNQQNSQTVNYSGNFNSNNAFGETSQDNSNINLANAKKPIDVTCKGYDVSFLSTQTNSVHYVQARPRSPSVSNDASNKMCHHHSETFDSSRRIYDNIEYISTTCPMNESVKYVRPEYAIPATSYESAKFSKTEDSLRTRSLLAIDSNIEVYPSSDFKAMSNQTRKYVEEVSNENPVDISSKTFIVSDHSRGSNQIDDSHPVSLEYVETIQKSIDVPCKSYISAGNLVSQSIKYVEPASKPIDSSHKTYTQTSSEYSTSNSVIQPIKHSEKLPTPIDASCKTYSDHSARRLEQEHLSEPMKYVPTIQKTSDAKSYVGVQFVEAGNNASQSVKYVESIKSPVENTIKTYVSSESSVNEHSRVTVPLKYAEHIHKQIEPNTKVYESSKFDEKIHHLPVSEPVKFVEALPKASDTTHGNFSYEKSEYYVPVTISQTQYRCSMKQDENPVQSYSGGCLTYTVPINVDEVTSSKPNPLENLYGVTVDDVKDLTNSSYAVFVDENHDTSGKHSDRLEKLADIAVKSTNDTHPSSRYALTLKLMEAFEKQVGGSNKGSGGSDVPKYPQNLDHLQQKTYANESGESYNNEETQYPSCSEKQNSPKHFDMIERSKKETNLEGTITHSSYGNIITVKTEKELPEEACETLLSSPTEALDYSENNAVILKDHRNSAGEHLNSAADHSPPTNIVASNMKEESMLQDSDREHSIYVPTYLCWECNTLFSTNESLHQHLSTSHQNEMP